MTATSLMAQPAASIRGKVVDTNNAALPGVTVEVTPLSGGTTLVGVTGTDGTYSIPSLPPGQYNVSFRLLNFATSIRPNVSTSVGEPAIVNTRLPLSANSEIVVTGKKTFSNLVDLNEPINGLIGIADAANVGVVTAAEIEVRPTQRSGDVFESVPGVIISQHSGEGKANQYYLRGFNLDHGTDIAITIAGVPVNVPTHGHGQGYADANFLIPELISGLQFRKGPFSAEDGDFAAAGAVNVNYANTLEHGLASVEGGSFGFQRALLADAPRLGAGHLLYALELSHNNGPWVNPDNFRKLNGVLRYTQGNEQTGFSLTAMGYKASWNSTDQIPDRAVSERIVSPYGAIDPTDGAQTHRYSLSGAWQQTRQNSLTKAEVYAIDYGLRITSNFTYFLDDPVNGDQFQQRDRRSVEGLKLSQQWLSNFGSRSSENHVGLQIRNDNIPQVALFKTKAREILSTVRDDSVLQTSYALYYQNSLQWTPTFRTVLGARGDSYRFRVHSDITENSGKARSSLFSPKLTAILGPFNNTEFYANYGYGFHSNDGRGATLTRDPVSGEPADRVSPLVRAKGAEVGARTTAIPHLQSTLSLWGLDVASELVFSGDAGTTSPSRPSRRYGIEWSNRYHPLSWLTFDGDLILSHARFTEIDPSGQFIPGAPGTIFSAGVVAHPEGNPFVGGIRFRYFGERPLIEDNSARSKPSKLVQARLGYELPRGFRVDLELFNLLNAKVTDIDYFYRSRLPNEPAEGVDGVHSHPVEPRSVRIGIGKTF